MKTALVWGPFFFEKIACQRQPLGVHSGHTDNQKPQTQTPKRKHMTAYSIDGHTFDAETPKGAADAYSEFHGCDTPTSCDECGDRRAWIAVWADGSQLEITEAA